jgi:hypothetical protein
VSAKTPKASSRKPAKKSGGASSKKSARGA